MTRPICPHCGSHTGFGAVKCFRCGVYTPNTVNSEWSKPRLNYSEVAIPYDLILDPAKFSGAALTWLYTAGIYPDVIYKQKIGYSPSQNKVFIPAIDDKDNIRWYQMRALDDDDVKYMTYGEISKYTVQYFDHTENVDVIIVEDHLSAIRLRKHLNVICLSGTSLNTVMCNTLATMFTTFVFWLDPDRPGQTATHKNYARLKRQVDSAMVRSLFTTKILPKAVYGMVNSKHVPLDPKFYTDTEIQKILITEVLPCIHT